MTDGDMTDGAAGFGAELANVSQIDPEALSYLEDPLLVRSLRLLDRQIAQPEDVILGFTADPGPLRADVSDPRQSGLPRAGSRTAPTAARTWSH